MNLRESFAAFDAQRDGTYHTTGHTADGYAVAIVDHELALGNEKGTLQHRSKFSEWNGDPNPLTTRDWVDTMDDALASRLPLRLIVATGAKSGARKISDCTPRSDIVGYVDEWDGENLTITFRRASV